MGDIIRLLPESVSNQIAAGEVVQRPASAVKELLENAVDAGATEIKLLIRDAGKSMIQVTDNGCGMSERDARMCFERHATSKIKHVNDLLEIRTLGFRGEALASIASVAQVELKSRRTEDPVGTSVQINGSDVISQTPVASPPGTAVTVRNLFYNVPARRNFLKSNTLELKYILEEFNRVALVHPDISFLFYNQEKILFQLASSGLKQRLISLLGAAYNQRLIPVIQETQLVRISGFIGKPEFAKKNHGEQYFFTNGRFIKNPYLNHAVVTAFQELIPKDAFPSYFIYLEVDPKSIDINIHPTKTEINFQDAKSIYAILHSSVRQAIGKFNLAPALNFETEKALDLPPLHENREIQAPAITVNPDYNPFEKQTRPQFEFRFTPPGPQVKQQGWQEVLDMKDTLTRRNVIQVENRYLVTHLANGIIVIDQQLAHERILYEQFLRAEKQKEKLSQKLLLPQTVTVTPEDAEIMKDLNQLLDKAGFEVSEFGRNTFVVHATPYDLPVTQIQPVLEALLESWKTETDAFAQKGISRVAQILARRLAVKHGQRLLPQEMENMVELLTTCSVPDRTPDGRPTMIALPYDELVRKFKNRS